MSASYESQNADTEPIPILRVDEAPLKWHERFGVRATAFTLLGVVALSPTACAVGITLARGHVIERAYDDTLPPESEQNGAVSILANDILDDLEVNIDCNTEATQESGKESQKDGQTLAFVKTYTIVNETYVPPNITMQGAICQDLLTFPRMDIADDTPHSSTYEVRATQFAKGVAILLHEAEHIHLVLDEGEATCYAFQKLPEALEPYMPTKEQALNYAKDAALDLSLELKDEYTSEECKPGGAYDLSISPVYTTNGLAFGTK